MSSKALPPSVVLSVIATWIALGALAGLGVRTAFPAIGGTAEAIGIGAGAGLMACLIGFKEAAIWNSDLIETSRPSKRSPAVRPGSSRDVLGHVLHTVSRAGILGGGGFLVAATVIALSGLRVHAMVFVVAATLIAAGWAMRGLTLQVWGIEPGDASGWV